MPVPHTARASAWRARLARRAGGTAAGRAGARRPRPAPPPCAACLGIGSLSGPTAIPLALEKVEFPN